jgi:ABC-type polysaccharide/polyol phosphate transport system ATPase subunit
MSDIVIGAENLGKKYIIGHQAENGRYVTLRDVVTQNVRGLWHKTKDLVQGKPIIQGDTLEEIWALKDVSFEIRRGEAMGVIGRNGAGKSTLLKVLSRITEPSAGRVTIKGRVASLLEVGTGFHPELTGRENIYLNGAILGMTRHDIKCRFDEIVAFAEIAKFLDTPVKRYSSGMYVRLAFAVAAHLEPEILMVDEVLAVGDAEFQKKCLGKMGDVAKMGGRTVLFVSHNMAAVLRLCTRTLLLNKGRVECAGNSPAVVAEYLSSLDTTLSSTFVVDYDQPSNANVVDRMDPDAPAYLLSGDVQQEGSLGHSDVGIQAILFSKPWCIKVRYRVIRKIDNLTCGVRISDGQEHFVLNTGECFTEHLDLARSPGTYEATCHVPAGLILPGDYTLDVGLDIVGGACVQGIRGVARWTIMNDDLILGQFQDGRLVGVIGSKMTPWQTKRLDKESGIDA